MEEGNCRRVHHFRNIYMYSKETGTHSKETYVHSKMTYIPVRVAHGGGEVSSCSSLMRSSASVSSPCLDTCVCVCVCVCVCESVCVCVCVCV